MILISKKSQERRQKAIERGTYSAASASPPIERNCAPPASGQKELYCPIIYHGPSASDGTKKLIEPIEFHGPPPSDGAKKLIEPIEFHGPPPSDGPKKLIEPIEFHGPPPSDGAKKLIEPIEFHGPPPSDGAKKLIEPIEFHERPNTPAPAESPPSVFSCADNAAQQPPSNSYDFYLRQMIDYKPQAADAAREERNRSAMIAALSPRTLDGAPLAPPAADVIVKAQIPVFRPPVSPSPENPYNPIVFASEFENGKIPDDLEYVEGYAKTTTLPNGESHIQTFFADPVRNLTPEQQYALEVGQKMLHSSAPKQERPPDPSPADNAYLSGGVGMVIDRPEEGCLFVDGKNGLLRLTNFRVLAAESRLVIGKNASAEPTVEYVLRIICGPITTDITLAPNELENAQRKIQNSVPSCIVHPVHPKANPLLVNFIRQQLAAVPQKTVVQRTGFLKLNGVWQYVHDGAVPPAATVFDTGIITIKQLQCKDGEYFLETPKSGRGRSILPAPVVMEALKKEQEKQQAAKAFAGACWSNPMNLVFTDAIGKHLVRRTVVKHFKKVAERAGVEESRFHDLKHTFAVTSLYAGDDIKSVQVNLGHATAQFTLDVYGHVTQTMRKESAERMQRFYDQLNFKECN